MMGYIFMAVLQLTIACQTRDELHEARKMPGNAFYGYSLTKRKKVL